MKTIIIGATGGIGAALSRRLAATGHTIHAIGRDPAKLAALTAEIGGSHAVADVMDRAQLEAAIASAGPSVSGLAYCVGSINLKPVTRITDEDVERDFRLNALGAFRAVQLALPALKVSGNASVVLFSTVAAELAPKIRVNCVAPSLTKTPLATALTGSEQMAAAIAALHPLQRLGEADDVAAAAAFLLSPDAAWISGQVIGVDGGRSTLRTKG